MLIQISSGKGPEECELAVGKFMRSIMKEINDIEIVEETRGKYKDCFKSVLLSTSHDVSHLIGTVKWIVQSPFRPKHKRKNWFIDVKLFEEQEEIHFQEKDVRFETFRCSGHGGQNVNKVETGVRAIHVPTGISVVCTEERTQHINKKLALIRLSEILTEQNIEAKELAKQMMWIQHELLERGNPIRIYKGSDFKRIK
jgi:peptide chain release factor